MIISIYKPVGPTSFDIIAQIRRVTGVKRVGHAGTLDPLAKGVLVVAIGREDTKRLSSIVKKEKEYVATIHFGATSTTDDEEGPKTSVDVTTPPSISQVRDALQRFVGVIQQMPPSYSAIKVAGVRSYAAARRGKLLDLKPREVEIKEIELQSYKWPTAVVRVVTGPGVYIRSLARDLGSALGVGGYLVGLVRTRVGDFRIEDAVRDIHLLKGEG